VLRGSIGADFENHGRISQGVDCGCFGGGERNRERLILAKGPFCFVFVNERSHRRLNSLLLYKICECRLNTQRAQDGSNLDGAEYELTFATEAIAQEFVDAAQAQQYAAATDRVRHRLGHGHLLPKSSSVLYAEAVAHQTSAERMLRD
jgi:hypothetical protein